MIIISVFQSGPEPCDFYAMNIVSISHCGIKPYAFFWDIYIINRFHTMFTTSECEI